MGSHRFNGSSFSPEEEQFILQNWRKHTAAVLAGLVNNMHRGNPDAPVRTRNAIVGKIYRLRKEGKIADYWPKQVKLAPVADPTPKAYKKRPRLVKPKPFPEVPQVAPQPPEAPAGAILDFRDIGGGILWHHPDGCAYLAGEPREFNWCNHRVESGSPYCGYHASKLGVKYVPAANRVKKGSFPKYIT